MTVNGRLGKTGDVDGFRVALRKGQTLVAMLEANRRLGSPMDGVLQVASAEGFVLAQVDDELDRDPRIHFEAPADGDYLVRAFAFPIVQDSTIRFAGGPAFIYRLTLTTAGFLDHAYPLSTTIGRPSEVEVVGWNVPDLARRVTVEATEGRDSATAWHPSMANPVEVRAVEGPSTLEREPNGRGRAQAVALPMAVSGRIDRPGDVDVFSFSGRKGETILFRVESRGFFGQPLDAVLRVGDASGATIVEVDDARKGFDPEVRFTVPADGSYQASIRDLNGQGSPRHAYLLTAGPPRPDFALSIKVDRFDLIHGKSADLVVAVDRREATPSPSRSAWPSTSTA